MSKTKQLKKEVKEVKIELSPELVAGIHQYLSSRPIAEVNNIFNALTVEAEPQFKVIQQSNAEK